MFSKFFIERPIFATVIALIIVIAGLVAMKALPVAQYPTITPVQIQVSATYPGADSKTVGDSVAAPIEAQVNGVDNMLYMTSTSSSTGQMTLTVYFTLDTNPDIAQVQVQNRVNLAMPQLPEAVAQFGVSVQKKSASTLMIIAVYNKDGRYSPEYVANYTNVYILDAIKRVNGAGQAQIFGVPDQAMRIWMNPDRMASLGITTTDIQNAVSKQNAMWGAGQVGQQPSSDKVQLTFPVVTQAPYLKPSQYEDIILRASQDGSAIVRVKDVARAEVGRRLYIDDNRLNGAPATVIGVYQQPGANGLDVSKAVRKTMEDLKRTMPDGIEYLIALDTTDFVRLSIEEVIHTLLEAIVLVVLVVYLFLQSFRSTIICTVAIFVSLIGTFAGMLALGFSINLLTLFGIVLAIGMVVDDAIVVVENVERNMAKSGTSPRQATDEGHGGDRHLAHRRGAGHGVGLHPGRLPSRHHGAALQAVCHHHRHLRRPVRVRGIDAYPGHVRDPAETFRASPERPFCLVQPPVRPLYPGFRRCGGVHDQADECGVPDPGRPDLGACPPFPDDPDKLRAQRGPGLPVWPRSSCPMRPA